MRNQKFNLKIIEMNKGDILTVQDLMNFGEKFKKDIGGLIQAKINPLRDFFTPKEFGARIGRPYSTVVYMCKTGKLKAFQESPNCSWLIHSSELERFVKAAEANVTGE
jgi:hypothetical protein